MKPRRHSGSDLPSWASVPPTGSGIQGSGQPRSSMWGRLCLWGCLWAQRQASPASNAPSVDRRPGYGHPREGTPARFPWRTWEPCTLPPSGHAGHAANHNSLGLFLAHGGQALPSRGGPELRAESPGCLRRGVPSALRSRLGVQARATVEVPVLLRDSQPCRPPAPPEGPQAHSGVTPALSEAVSQPGARAWRTTGRPWLSGLVGRGPFLEAPGSLGWSLPPH